jgi:hypothetical protein
VSVLPQKESWLCEPVPILPSLQVKVERAWALVGNLACQSCFSDLTRPLWVATSVCVRRIVKVFAFAAIEGPRVPLIAREQQFAEKVQAYSLPRNHPNRRVKDLVDMALFIGDSALDRERLLDALRLTSGLSLISLPCLNG